MPGTLPVAPSPARELADALDQVLRTRSRGAAARAHRLLAAARPSDGSLLELVQMHQFPVPVRRLN